MQTKGINNKNWHGILKIFRLRLFIWILFSIQIAACAPSLYSVNMKYEPSTVLRRTDISDASKSKYLVTVATWEDSRKIPDHMVLGHVTKVDGRKIPVLPKYLTAQDAITSGVKKHLSQSGYTVSGNNPAWNLNSDSIRSDWGDIVVGGSIDQLEVICRNELLAKEYESKVGITIYFADVRNKRIFYKTSALSSGSFGHFIFSEEKLESLLNDTLAHAIEKVFEGVNVEQKILDAMTKRSSEKAVSSDSDSE